MVWQVLQALVRLDDLVVKWFSSALEAPPLDSDDFAMVNGT